MSAIQRLETILASHHCRSVRHQRRYYTHKPPTLRCPPNHARGSFHGASTPRDRSSPGTLTSRRQQASDESSHATGSAPAHQLASNVDSIRTRRPRLRIQLRDPPAQERLECDPHGSVGERTESDQPALLVRAHRRGQTNALESVALALGALHTGLAVVVRVDSVPAALDRPDRESRSGAQIGPVSAGNAV